MLDLGRVFNAPKWKIFAKIRIPNALPYILSALKITATAAVVGAIVGEFVASQKGLGYVIVTTQSSMNTSVAFAALVWISSSGSCCTAPSCSLAQLWAPWAEGDRLNSGKAWEGRIVMTRTLSLALAALLAAGRQRLGAGEVHLRAQLVRRSATTPPTGWRSTRATTRPRAST